MQVFIRLERMVKVMELPLTEADCAETCVHIMRCTGFAFSETVRRCEIYGPGLLQNKVLQTPPWTYYGPDYDTAYKNYVVLCPSFGLSCIPHFNPLEPAQTQEAVTMQRFGSEVI